MACGTDTVPFTLPESEVHRTQVWLVGFGDSALNFELVVWPSLEAIKRPASARAAYTWAIEEALRRADIEMPFPQMDLRVRSLFGREGDHAALLAGLRPPEPARRSEVGRSTNDAAEDLLSQAAGAGATGATEGDEPDDPEAPSGPRAS